MTLTADLDGTKGAHGAHGGVRRVRVDIAKVMVVVRGRCVGDKDGVVPAVGSALDGHWGEIACLARSAVQEILYRPVFLDAEVVGRSTRRSAIGPNDLQFDLLFLHFC